MAVDAASSPSGSFHLLGKITRRISIDRWRMRNAQKRGGGEVVLVLDELEDCVSGSDSVEGEMERRELAELLNSF